MINKRRQFLKTAILGAMGSSLMATNSIANNASDKAKKAGLNSKIKSIEVTIRRKKPNPNPIKDAIQTLPGIGHVEVKVTTDDNISGVGSIWFGRISGGPDALKAMIEYELKPLIIGTELAFIRDSFEKMVRETDYHGTIGLATLGISAIDTALWDCFGKTLETPCWQLWGGCNTKIPVYANIGWLNYSDKEIQQKCEETIKKGYRAIKIKIGAATLKDDVKRIKTVKRILGDDIRLMVDANQALTVGEAIMRGRAFEDLGLYWFEEPIPAHDVEGYRKIAAELTIQIATGENIFSPQEFALFVKRDAVDIIQPDLRRSGGPTALLEIGRMANSFGVPYASHGGGSVQMNVLACLPNMLYLETGGGSTVENGMIDIPSEPGFGR